MNAVPRPRHVDNVVVAVSALGPFGSKQVRQAAVNGHSISAPSCRPCLSSPSERASFDLSCIYSVVETAAPEMLVRFQTNPLLAR